MSTDKPRVSVGLAVYNGERYLEGAITSILAQTFTDFELIISDNASTDRTAAICRAYADRDRRIRYHRNETNIGGANNENLTCRLATGEYFRWAAYDDVCAPTLIAECVAVLDASPDVVLCYSQIVDIDEDGNPLRTVSQRKGTSPRPSQRFRDLARRDHNCEATYGLIRTDALRRTELQKNYTDSDRTLLCELALYGRFFEIDKPLFYKRYHPRNVYINMRSRMAWFDPAWKGAIVFPFWMQFADYLATIHRARLPLPERLRCYAYMAWWLVRHGRNLAGDVFLALCALARPSRGPYEWRTKKKNVYNWE